MSTTTTSDAGSDTPKHAAEGGKRIRHRWIVIVTSALLLVIIVVIVVLAIGSGEDGDDGGFEEINQTFNGEDQPLADPPWTVAGGEWSQEAGTARVDLTPADRSFVTLDAHATDLTLRVRFRTTAGSTGVVFRYQDPENFWAVMAAPGFGTWNLIRFVDGEGQTIANTSLTLVRRDTVVDIAMVGDIITVLIDGVERREVTDVSEQLTDTTRVGFLAVRNDAGAAEGGRGDRPRGDGRADQSVSIDPEDARWDSLEVLPPPG